jgi:hypothetical protein
MDGRVRFSRPVLAVAGATIPGGFRSGNNFFPINAKVTSSRPLFGLRLAGFVGVCAAVASFGAPSKLPGDVGPSIGDAAWAGRNATQNAAAMPPTSPESLHTSQDDGIGVGFSADASTRCGSVHNLCTGNDYFLGFRSSKDYKPSVPLHSKDAGLIAGAERDATDPVACAGLSRSRRTG